jgi:hypothetical protein
MMVDRRMIIRLNRTVEDFNSAVRTFFYWIHETESDSFVRVECLSFGNGAILSPLGRWDERCEGRGSHGFRPELLERFVLEPEFLRIAKS